MMTLNEAWQSHNLRFEEELRSVFTGYADEELKALFESMSYSLNAGGKRLRPFLVSLFCRTCGGDPEAALPAALAIEMVHTYSLIHDDLPAMDNDNYRRGKLTNHKVYGEAMAILAGDGLLTDAFRLLCDRLPAEQALSCVRILSAAAGPNGMVGGQALDISASERACTEKEVLAIQSRKTGALIVAACQMGAVCGGGKREALDAAAAYGSHLGLAFQIRDDMLDVIGSAEELGKPVGDDAEKNTFVKLYGLDRCAALVETETKKAVRALDFFPEAKLLTELAGRMAVRKK